LCMVAPLGGRARPHRPCYYGRQIDFLAPERGVCVGMDGGAGVHNEAILMQRLIRGS